MRGYNLQIQNKPWRVVGRYAFGGAQEPSNAQTPANAAQKGQVVKKAGKPFQKNGKETDSPNKALKEGGR